MYVPAVAVAKYTIAPFVDVVDVNEAVDVVVSAPASPATFCSVEATPATFAVTRNCCSSWVCN